MRKVVSKNNWEVTMYNFFMDLFGRYPKFFTFIMILAMLGFLAVVFVMAFVFYKFISLFNRGKKKEQELSEVDKRQDEEIERISKETKKALALQKELDSLRERVGAPRED